MPKKASKAVKVQEAVVVEAPNQYLEEKQSVESMISQAIKEKLPMETMEKFMAMRRELKDEFAKEQFVRAMSKFQKNCPVIKKTKVVSDNTGKERYRYAPIDSIVSQVREAISEAGLSYNFKNTKTDKEMTVECVVTHLDGHTESSSFVVNMGEEKYMTDTQKAGARSTFAKRYAFCDAFGIMTGDEDDDAVDEVEKIKTVTPEQVDVAKKIIDACKTDSAIKSAWDSFTKEQRANNEIREHTAKIRSFISNEKKNENS